ncbi:hypothetical protein RND71_011593 [Anisodus tanguticus]|uniref:Uncharacterized protein n=1 Tax=Anisodus tanguticus TaxID=243964 RepID=A0AAE1SDP4_9SOLA|nr:hypothetical protein RND71_011593 [Anisodus tanguticus]
MLGYEIGRLTSDKKLSLSINRRYTIAYGRGEPISFVWDPKVKKQVSDQINHTLKAAPEQMN